ncbi:MAG: LysR family transcriptional regulator [Magnetococcales bacterium]|nr:LysR family transcriptional regulator [Magnetococcales bacterium]
MNQLLGMQIFVAVIDHGGFSAAARILGSSVGRVSKGLAALENHLGVPLLQRTTRQWHLTWEGERYLAHCRQILSEVKEADRSVGKGHSITGRLRISAPVAFGHRHVAPLLLDFMTRHPGIEVNLELSDPYVNLVAEGFDLAIRIGNLVDSSLRFRRLGSFHLMAMAAPDYLDKHGKLEHPGDLVHHTCLLYTLSASESVGVWSFTDQAGHEIRIKVAGRLSSNNGEVLRQAALAGHGIMLTPSFILRGDEVSNGSLQVILADYPCLGGGIFAVYPPNRHLSTRVRACVDFLAQGWAGEPPVTPSAPLPRQARCTLPP